MDIRERTQDGRNFLYGCTIATEIANYSVAKQCFHLSNQAVDIMNYLHIVKSLAGDADGCDYIAKSDPSCFICGSVDKAWNKGRSST
jgi:hypothetical protein